MSGLGDLLELLHGAGDSFRSVRATVRTWRHEARTAAALDRFAAASSGTVAFLVAVADADDEPPATTERVERFWFEPPARMRSEVEGESTSVTDGVRSWQHTPRLGTITSEEPAGEEAGPLAGGVDALLDPALVIGALDFELDGRERYIGRDALRVRARPRTLAADVVFHDFGGLAPGADEYRLLVDAERGVLLRAVALLDGEELGRTELLEVAFDEAFPPGTFTFEPPAGEPVRTQEDMKRLVPRDVSLEEAARRAPFPVWIPARVPAGWTMEVLYAPAIEEWSHPERVSIAYHSFDEPPASVHVQQAAAGDEPPPGPRWRMLERDGRELFVLEERGRVPAQVRLEREGTAVTLSGQNVEPERLLELAASLVRAPTEPPPVRG